MALFKKKSPDSTAVHPQELDQMSREEADRGKGLKAMFAVRRTGSALIITKAMKRAIAALIALLLLLMGLSYMIAALIIRSGSFIISVMDDIDDEYSLSLSETPDFTNPTTVLRATPIVDMDNITYEWIGDDFDGDVNGVDTINGSHNGENYVAYTFYLKSAGTKPLTYEGEIEIVGVAKGIDAAVRIMVYKNGIPTIYALPREDGTMETFCVDQSFVSEDVVMHTMTEGLAPGEMDKYTIVVWLEGEDPECVNAVLGGIMKMKMDFKVILVDD